jgi:hypothetical protein
MKHNQFAKLTALTTASLLVFFVIVSCSKKKQPGGASQGGVASVEPAHDDKSAPAAMAAPSTASPPTLAEKTPDSVAPLNAARQMARGVITTIADESFTLVQQSKDGPVELTFEFGTTTGLRHNLRIGALAIVAYKVSGDRRIATDIQIDSAIMTALPPPARKEAPKSIAVLPEDERSRQKHSYDSISKKAAAAKKALHR